LALAAGLSGVVQSTGLVITAGLAEVAAGAIAMGLGGYLAARTDDGARSATVLSNGPPAHRALATRTR
jgi:hypothetical protein